MTKTKTAAKKTTAAPEQGYLSPPVRITLRRKAAAKTTETASPPFTAPAAPAKGKLGQLTALLLRTEGATLAAMQEATGWQAHSVRGAISGSLKKKLGLEVISEKVEGVRTYRIAKGATA